MNAIFCESIFRALVNRRPGMSGIPALTALTTLTTLTVLTVLTVLLLSLASVAQAATEVIRLQRTSPVETAGVLRAAFGRALGIAEAPMINAVVIRGEDAALVAEAVALARDLDRPEATLRFTISTQEASNEQNRRLGLNRGGIVANTSHRSGNDQETRVVVGTENRPLALIDEMTIPYTWQSAWGEETVLIRRRAGVQISGRLGDGGTVTVSVWYGQGLGETSSHLISQISGPLGQWLDLGMIATEGDSITRRGGIDDDALVAGRSTHRQGAVRHYRVKVERVR